MEVPVNGKLKLFCLCRAENMNTVNFPNFLFSLRVLGEEERELENAATSNPNLFTREHMKSNGASIPKGTSVGLTVLHRGIKKALELPHPGEVQIDKTWENQGPERKA